MTRQEKQRIINAKVKYYKAKYPSITSEQDSFEWYHKSDTNSNDFESCMVDYLKFEGHQAEKIKNKGTMVDNTKAVKDVLGRVSRIGSVDFIKGSGTNGTPDVHAHLAPFGTFWGIENKQKYKKGKDKQSEAQMKYEKKHLKVGAYYSLVSNMGEFFLEYDRIIEDIKNRVNSLQSS